MKKVLSYILLTLICLNVVGQNDTITIFDYWEPSRTNMFGSKTGYSEDYLQVIINDIDTIYIDARNSKCKIKFKHDFWYIADGKKMYESLWNVFDNNVKFAGLQILKPVGENIKIRVSAVQTNTDNYRNKFDFDTVLNYSSLPNNRVILWNLYLFWGGLPNTRNQFYPRYTLHSHNWPTPAQLARRKKVRQQIERAIVYRYNTTTRQITKS
jgi:hypothetical protein